MHRLAARPRSPWTWLASTGAVPVALLALVWCAPPEEPDAPSGPPGPRSCGVEVVRLGQGYDAAARACFWEAYKARDPAQLTTTWHTIEGDPVTYTLTITRAGVEVVVDSKDRFGQQGVHTHTCRNLEQIMQDPKMGQKDRFGFALSGCTGGGADRLGVP